MAIITPIIIGIAGEAHAGKDTAASMIDYILRNGINKADYYKWESGYNSSVRIIHFADTLKQYCSQIFNIPGKYFYDTDYKDNYVYHFTTESFIKRDELDTDKYGEITIKDLEAYNNNLMEVRRAINRKGKVSVISLRTIMQYIGTNIFRNLISKDIWVDICINEAIDCSDNGWCIIPDVRFKNEAEAIKSIDDRKTILIKINRNTDKIINSNHESENIDFDCDYEIDNKDTKLVLFYKLLMILKEII